MKGKEESVLKAAGGDQLENKHITCQHDSEASALAAAITSQLMTERKINRKTFGRDPFVAPASSSVYTDTNTDQPLNISRITWLR